MTVTSESYYGNVRSDIERLLPERAPARVLEIGAAAGGTMSWLKARWPEAEFVALDAVDAVRNQLEQIANHVVIHDLEKGLPEMGKFDLILALDVLEHLSDPWATARQLHDALSSNGSLIVSVPNVTHYKVLRPMAVRGRFEYTDSGFLDRTHLRFFDRISAENLISQANLVATRKLMKMGRRNRFFHRLTLGVIPHLFATHFIIRGEPSGRAPTSYEID